MGRLGSSVRSPWWLHVKTAKGTILAVAPIELDEVREILKLARREDLGSGDISTELLPQKGQDASFLILLKEPAVLAGCALANEILATYGSEIQIDWREDNQDGVAKWVVPAVLAGIDGPLGLMLAAERVLLNFLQRLCGVATLTRKYVDAIAGTPAKIFDTRKTTPGWRALEKYAVRCGGGHNHRMGLFDAVLIKDNHLAGVETSRLAARVFEMLNRLDAEKPKPTFVAVEAQSIEQAAELFRVVGVDVLLLDNFALGDLCQAVELRDEFGLRGKVELEASGGIRLENVRAVAETGVDRISVGAITHSAVAIDMSLERD